MTIWLTAIEAPTAAVWANWPATAKLAITLTLSASSKIEPRAERVLPSILAVIGLTMVLTVNAAPTAADWAICSEPAIAAIADTSRAVMEISLPAERIEPVTPLFLTVASVVLLKVLIATEPPTEKPTEPWVPAAMLAITPVFLAPTAIFRPAFNVLPSTRAESVLTIVLTAIAAPTAPFCAPWRAPENAPITETSSAVRLISLLVAVTVDFRK